MQTLSHCDLDQIEIALCINRHTLLGQIRNWLDVHGGTSLQLHQSMARRHAVNHALRRIDFGVAGSCGCCGAPIDRHRLRGCPTTTTWRACDDGSSEAD